MPTSATTPATTAAMIARRRKYSAVSSSSKRFASPTRYTAARNAQTTTARTPPRIDVGLIQLSQVSPATPPSGTRPDAIAPATVPMKNGTITDEIANAAPKLRREEVRYTSLRNAKLEPRSTMPSAARLSGTNSVSMIDPNASGNDGHSTTSTKISQTWFASQTGPIEWSTTLRAFLPRSAPPAIRSQKPAPKSAPPNSAYAVMPKNSTTAMTSLIAAAPGGDRHLLGFGVGRRDRLARAVRRVVVARVALGPEAPAHGAQDQDQRDGHGDVEDRDHEERRPHPLVAGGRLLDLELLEDDPGLSPDLGDDPPGLHRDHRCDAGDRSRAQEPFPLRHPPLEDPDRPPPDRQQEEQGAEPDHHVPREEDGVDLARVRSCVHRERVEPLDLRVGAIRGVRQDRPATRDGDASADRAVVVEVAEERLGDVTRRLRHELDRSELDGLVVVDPARERVADEHLDRRRDGRDRERDDEAEPVVVVAPTAQHAHRVDGRDEEAAHEVRRDEHVERLQRHRLVEDHLERFDVGDATRAVEREAPGFVHPRVRGDDRDGAADPGDDDRDARPEVVPRL